MFIKCKHFTMVISDHGNSMWLVNRLNVFMQRRFDMHMCMLHIFKNISHEPIGYNTKISTEVRKGSFNIWIVLWIRVVWFL